MLNLKNCEVCIVGLGLIGGSIMKGLFGKVKKLTAIDTDKESLNQANSYLNNSSLTPEISYTADIIILAIYPNSAVNFIQENYTHFNKNVVVTDVTGVKSTLFHICDRLNVKYVGGHPMAGKEVWGYVNSEADLFENKNYLLIPSEKCSNEDINLIKSIAIQLRCGKITETTPQNHDKMIAYTSQLPHIIAGCMCKNPLIYESHQYTGGSFEDVTRVGKINEELWTQLFLQNKDALIKQMDVFLDNFTDIKAAILENDQANLFNLLKKIRECKEATDDE